jgi:hypothetical protein
MLCEEKRECNGIYEGIGRMASGREKRYKDE